MFVYLCQYLDYDTWFYSSRESLGCLENTTKTWYASPSTISWQQILPHIPHIHVLSIWYVNRTSSHDILFLFYHFMLILICFSFIIDATTTTPPSTTTTMGKTTLFYLWYRETLTSVTLTNSVLSFLWIHGQILKTFKQLLFSLCLVAYFHCWCNLISMNK